ncbi:APC family permease [Streptacidiphilus fuscans]|uniref:APC family permease n=1 Tax=Streptacidiphilus fuscans TaxID=2789292 RepID=A0A931B2Y4_9ACTN|nr:APC family permease [Streptacidiphilus fuscans]MBF9068317.1 APC family permease [Streptacidiphilus fuscans]
MLKRLVIGRAMRSEELGETLLPKRVALPIFASDPLSSVAYATQEILLVLTIGGTAFLYLTPWIGLAVVVLMAVVVTSYRQVVYAYPSGGGSFEVVTTNLGPNAGLVVAASLLVDYVMTVAVSVASGVDNIISAFNGLAGYRVLMAVLFVALLAAINLRGVRESGKAFAAPTYLFIAGIVLMVVTGFVKMAFGHGPVAESAKYPITPEDHQNTLAGFALVMLALRAFASGCTALTGVEAISNGVPAFRKPKSRNAAQTMVAMGTTAVVMFSGITILAMTSKIHLTNDGCQLVGFANCSTAPQETVIAQLAAAIFGGEHSVLFYYIQAVTALVLVLAANTAFNGFPLLASILAQHRYVPRQFHTRGDRLAFSNGILALALVNIALLVAYKANVTNLIHLYILGVFTSFTLSQIGMVRHWNELLRNPGAEAKARAAARRSRVINAFGAVTTGLVLVIVMITKFTQGAWLAVVAAVFLFVNMKAIRRHYDDVAEELEVTDPVEELSRPAKVHGVVLVSKLHKATLRAIGYAEALRPDTLEAVTVSVERGEAGELERDWREYDLDIPLKVLDSPYREITRPVIAYVRGLRKSAPRDAVAVFIPEYVVGHWWEQPLHNQSALWLKSRLLFMPGVMVISVPWQLDSSRAAMRPSRRAPGAVRRGLPPVTPRQLRK